jgi:hypothetical protein
MATYNSPHRAFFISLRLFPYPNLPLNDIAKLRLNTEITLPHIPLNSNGNVTDEDQKIAQLLDEYVVLKPQYVENETTK